MIHASRSFLVGAGDYWPRDEPVMKFIDGSSIETAAKLVNDFRKYRKSEAASTVADKVICSPYIDLGWWWSRDQGTLIKIN
jgi:hypothetical protein